MAPRGGEEGVCEFDGWEVRGCWFRGFGAAGVRTGRWCCGVDEVRGEREGVLGWGFQRYEAYEVRFLCCAVGGFDGVHGVGDFVRGFRSCWVGDVGFCVL